jgi:dipeptidyl-peptidase 4
MPRIFRIALTVFSASLLAAPLAVCQSASQSASQPAPLTVEAIFGHEPLTGTPPDGVTWSPDSKLLSYLEGGELIGVEAATGQRKVLVSQSRLAALNQAGGSEQDRDHRERYKMASYLWAPDSQHLLFDAGGRIWLYDLKSGIGIEAGFSGEASGDTPAFSPDGKAIAYVRDHGLTVVRSGDPGGNTAPVNIAPAPNANTMNGEVDWVYAEELAARQNFFWSPDSTHIACLQMNEEHVPQYPLTDWIPTHAKNEMQRYPQPSDPNPEVRVGVINARGGKTSWIRLPDDGGHESDGSSHEPSGSDHEYVPRFGWVDRHTVWIETLSRDQKHRAVYFADIAGSRDAVRMLDVADDKYLDDNYDVWVAGGAIVLISWKDGHSHIYLYSYDEGNPLSGPAAAPKQLTSGNWDVDAVLAVDAAHKTVFYTSNENAALEKQIARVNFFGERKQLTTAAGTHEGNISPDGTAFVDVFSTRMDPPRMSLCRPRNNDIDGECHEFWSSHPLDSYRIPAPVELTVKAADGTTLYATLLLPAGGRGIKSVPLIVNPYGGPGAQTVQNHWDSSLLFDALLAQRGFAVLHADNRGMAGRGREFEQAAYRDFGKVQLSDQLAALDAALEKFPQLDPKRLGWWGWSWGGTFTLYAMTHSDRFVAGVSVAPVTDWRNYDSIYTERYMGLPAEAADAYKAGSVVESATHLKGRLLLVHGTGDDNVHIENSVQFLDKLVDAGIPYDFQIFPRKTHAIAGPAARTELFNRIVAHFEQYLKPDTQPDANTEK